MLTKFNLLFFTFLLSLTLTESRRNKTQNGVLQEGRAVDAAEPSDPSNLNPTPKSNAEPISPDRLNPATEPPMRFKGYKYLGHGGDKFWYLPETPTYQSDATEKCFGLSREYLDEKGEQKYTLYLPQPDETDVPVMLQILTEQGMGVLWIAPNRNKDNFPKLDREQREIANDLQTLELEDGMDRYKRSSKQEAKLVSYSKGHSKRKVKRDADAIASAYMGTTGFQVTVKETHFPWLKTWSQNEQCKDLKGCEPVKCNVTTKTCEVSNTVNCVITNQTSCSVINSGKCTAICESCRIDIAPECWIAENKCKVVQDRQCTMTQPECHVTPSPCVITRPLCVTKQPPCKIKQDVLNVTEEECRQPSTCSKLEASTCKKIPRPCSEEETNSGKTVCEELKCDISPICILPEYCRRTGLMSFLECDPPTTFCPPEIVKCPPPNVVCDEPKLNCTEPVVDCPPPQARCSQPRVTCTTPKLSCPNVVTQCTNPSAICAPPDVTCDVPSFSCSKPQPCFISQTIPEMCQAEECDPDVCKCNVIKLSKDAEYDTPNTDCDKILPFVCVASYNPGYKNTKKPITQ